MTNEAMTNETTPSETAPAGTTRPGGRGVAAPMWPCLIYRDAPAAIDFLQRAFGFVQVARYGSGDVIEHAE
ncbi:MAG: hypothetical protein ACRD0P_22055, partial [Stackebrandtia sp.]